MTESEMRFVVLAWSIFSSFTCTMLVLIYLELRRYFEYRATRDYIQEQGEEP